MSENNENTLNQKNNNIYIFLTSIKYFKLVPKHMLRTVFPQ